ncbi:Glycosyl transferase, WecB/TagA/CpsF family [Candidatus Methylobacter favarea]|uniref:Glycosyl transferase, WecB/TagA/CpsF family n=1 Tax=Candidatus Methylobacter favarea TaxID=2707345 RepID=A0A8S0X9P8_9GAMM|nr:WecB/TagA/CpsF family glycosyltransferase [Candidatus Methylobacter favarea]CAA9892536.1 Glycosyl transferase, WecB/TagA/CpsF family [Candidatus Methylobacter favarea]
MANIIDKKINIFGITINPLTMNEAVDYVSGWIKAPEHDCKYIVTPNVNCVVLLSKHQGYRDAFQQASMVVVDGKPVVWAARMFGEKIPGTVTGSDLVPAIFQRFHDEAQHELKVFLLGAMPGIAELAAGKIEQAYQQVTITGFYSPPFGFENSPDECERICELISISGAEFLVIGLGAPKQATWVNHYADKLAVKVAICAGATIDFLAGKKPRAPKWMSRIGIEWFYRMATEPKRLTKRYLNDAFVFPKLVWNEWNKRG